MKCPKCHYLSFDPEPRCRNCGYDLELAEDLALKTEEGQVEGPLVDLSLRDKDQPRRAPITLELVRSASTAPAPSDAVAASAPLAAAADAVISMNASVAGSAGPAKGSASAAAVALVEAPEPPPAEPAARRDPKPPSTSSELPLFVKGMPQEPAPGRPDSIVAFASAAVTDEPLVRVPPAPRPPLAVRRSSTETPRPRSRIAARKVGPLDRDLLEDLQRIEKEQRQAPAESWESLRPSPPDHARVSEPEATMSTRFAAASIDAVLIGGIAAVVTYATLRLCDLQWHQLTVLPLLPLATFVLMIALGYLLMFTVAGGQTVGKMLMNIRVVSASGDASGLSVRQAAYREALSLPLVLGAGIGYLPTLLGRGPALHDRLADTRVVRG